MPQHSSNSKALRPHYASTTARAHTHASHNTIPTVASHPTSPTQCKRRKTGQDTKIRTRTTTAHNTSAHRIHAHAQWPKGVPHTHATLDHDAASQPPHTHGRYQSGCEGCGPPLRRRSQPWLDHNKLLTPASNQLGPNTLPLAKHIANNVMRTTTQHIHATAPRLQSSSPTRPWLIAPRPPVLKPQT